MSPGATSPPGSVPDSNLAALRVSTNDLENP